MRAIYQGRPPERQTWLEIPPDFVADYKRLGYEIRELVLLEEAEQAKVEHFNAGVEKAAVLAESYSEATAARAKQIRAWKLKPAKAKVTA